MIDTNQMKIKFNHTAIQRDFVIFEVTRDDGNYYRSTIPDAALQKCQALAVAYDWGKTCYILYRRSEAEKCALKQVLESCEDNVRIQEISSNKMHRNRLAQLLFNAIPNLRAGGRMYHNITGKLFYSTGKWIHKRKNGAVSDFYMLQISITQELCIKLDVVTFSPASPASPKDMGEPQYLYDGKSHVLRRALKDDPDKQLDRFVRRSAYSGRKNTIPFLEFGSLDEYYCGKTGVLHKFLKEAGDCLSAYLTMETVPLDEAAHIGKEKSDGSMERIRLRLQQIPLYLEDAVQTGESASLVLMLRQELERHSKIALLSGAPPKGSALIRIIHNKEYFENNDETDNYADAPKDCIVQHITVEDFHMTDKKEDPYLRKILQELAIKADVFEGRMTCYDWQMLGRSSALTFVTASKKKNEPAVYRRLRVLPDGSLEFDKWEEPPFFPAGSEREKIFLAYENRNGKFDRKINGLVYEDTDNIHIIRETDRFAFPDDFEPILKATQDKESLPVAPIADVVRCRYGTLTGKERTKCEQILDALSYCGTHILRKDLRRLVNLKTNLGKELNRLIFDTTGILISGRLKQKENLERLFAGVLDIRLFRKGQAQYYFSGGHGSDLKYKVHRACRIREVTVNDGTPQFECCLPLLEVGFVRADGWTVLPFPFKYLREWDRMRKLADN